MLPGFNHNIRYKDRVFHVQTEDNGIGQPRLVTQVFIEGHILAVEKASYQDILDTTIDREERTQMIRSKMQDQHRRLLKNLVQGAYDERITLYLGGPRSQPGGTPPLAAPAKESGSVPIPPALLAAAEVIPEAPSALGEAELEAWQPLRPEDLIEIEEPVDEGADTLRPAARGSDPQTRLADDLEAPPVSKPSNRPLPKDVADSSEFLSVLDAEMQRQLPWASSDEIMASPPPLRLDSSPGHEPPGKAEGPTPPPKAQPNFRDARRAAKVETPGLGKKAPPAADTLVDFGLPAALREQLAANLEARKKADARRPPGSPAAEPRSGRYGPGPITDDLPRRPSALESAAERQTVLDMELRRAAAEMSVPPSRGAPPSASDTLLEIDARELHRRVAEQRARLRSSPSEAPTPEPGALPHTERRPAEPLERFDSRRPNRTPSSGIRVMPVIQGEAVSPPPPEGENPKSILVVERSLDEVILSYLSDDQE